jgi:hypothetical protein
MIESQIFWFLGAWGLSIIAAGYLGATLFQPGITRQTWLRIKPHITVNRILDYVGAAAGVIGASVIAFNLGLNFWGYAVFMISSTFYTVFGYRTRNWGLLGMNAMFCVINTIGLIRYFS